MSQSEPVEQPSTKAPSYGSVEIGSDVPAAVDRKSALSRHARIAKLATLYRMRLTPSLINRIQSYLARNDHNIQSGSPQEARQRFLKKLIQFPTLSTQHNSPSSTVNGENQHMAEQTGSKEVQTQDDFTSSQIKSTNFDHMRGLTSLEASEKSQQNDFYTEANVDNSTGATTSYHLNNYDKDRKQKRLTDFGTAQVYQDPNCRDVFVCNVDNPSSHELKKQKENPTIEACKAEQTSVDDNKLESSALKSLISNEVLQITQRQMARYRLLARNLAFHDPKIREQRLLKKTTQPPLTSFAERLYLNVKSQEFRIASRISYRINELQTLPLTLGDECQRAVVIELLGLRLKDFQAELRQRLFDIGSGNGITSGKTCFRRQALRLLRPLSIRDPKQTEKMEQFQRQREQQEKLQRHQAFIQSILEHSEQFRHFHLQVRRTIKKQCRAVVNHHTQNERRQQQENERMEKERMKLLMAQDTEGYKKLLDEKKDSRKTFLLNKIEERMNIMGDKIKKHQQAEHALEQKLKSQHQVPLRARATQYESRGNNRQEDIEALSDRSEGKDEIITESAKNDGGNTKSEAVVFDAHAVKETVTQQPDMLTGGTLKPYQLTGLEWLVSLYNNRLNGILADEMGLGKTIQTIALLAYVAEVKNNFGPFLIIVPLATLSNWTLEFEKWAPTFNTITYKGTKHERRAYSHQIMEGRFNVLLTTYEMILREKSVLSKVQWQYMVVDEGHRMKNAKNKLSQTLAEYFTSTRRLLLTGTPLQNSLPELWALLNFLLPDVFNSSETFDSWFNAPFAGTGENMSLDEEETHLIILQLHKILRPFLLRRLKKEVETQLPDKVEYVLRCDMSALQRKVYSLLQKYGVTLPTEPDARKKLWVFQGASSVSSLKNMVMQLRKLCCHPFLFEEVEHAFLHHVSQQLGVEKIRLTNGPDLWRACGKFELLDRMLTKLRAGKHRTLIFSQFTTLLTVMEDYLNSKSIRYLRMDGTTSADDRAQLLKLFNAPGSNYEVFILSTRAGGLGLNLQSADTVIIYDSDWNPHQDLQAQDRAHRIGQTREVRVFRFVTVNSVEEKILERARFKLDVDQKVIQAGKFNRKSTETDSRQYLMSILAEVPEEEDGANALDNDELNQMLARNDNEITLFEEIDTQQKLKDSSWKNWFRKERLVQLEELPDVISRGDAMMHEVLTSNSVPETFGRGSRVRKRVSYSEDLTEREFILAVESGDVEKYIEKKREKLRRKEYKQDGSTEPFPQKSRGRGSRGRGSSRGAKVKRPRGRPRKINSTPPSSFQPNKTMSTRKTRTRRSRAKLSAICESDDDDEELLPNNETQIQDFEDDGPSSDEYRRMMKLYESMLDLKDKQGRLVAETFRDLPDEEESPEFYEMISHPIDLSDIKDRLRGRQYENMDDLSEDFGHMLHNAIQYYETDSQEYLDAMFMKENFEIMKQAVLKSSPLKQSLRCSHASPKASKKNAPQLVKNGNTSPKSLSTQNGCEDSGIAVRTTAETTKTTKSRSGVRLKITLNDQNVQGVEEGEQDCNDDDDRNDAIVEDVSANAYGSVHDDDDDGDDGDDGEDEGEDEGGGECEGSDNDSELNYGEDEDDDINLSIDENSSHGNVEDTDIQRRHSEASIDDPNNSFEDEKPTKRAKQSFVRSRFL